MLGAFLRSEDEFLAKAVEAAGTSTPTEQMIQDWTDRKELGLGMLKHYEAASPEWDKHWKPLLTEIEFEVPIPCRPSDLQQLVVGWPFKSTEDELWCWCVEHQEYHQVVYQGRVDLVVEDTRDGRLLIVDHKTAGQFGGTDYFDLDEQSGSYAWALHKILGLNISGIVFNQLLKAVPKPPERLKKQRNGAWFSVNKSQRTTYELYYRTLEENNEPIGPYIDFLEYLKENGNPFFRQVPVKRTMKEHATIERRILIEAIEMLDSPRIYPNPGMFNCMGCAFKVPCLAAQDGSDVTFILNENYQKRDNERTGCSD
jgi:hypothetical protein